MMGRTIYPALVVLFHVVGVAGFLVLSAVPLFLRLVPFHLLLMLALVIASQEEKGRGFWQFTVLAYVCGFLVELAGVHTGVIFGSYQYGPTLGTQLAGIPLLIGVNWVLLICAAGTVTAALPVKNPFFSAGLGALLLVLLDFLIEPVAIRFHYWSWNGDIPLQNYAAWFAFSFILLLAYQKLVIPKRNRAAIALFVSEVVFFALLNR